MRTPSLSFLATVAVVVTMLALTGGVAAQTPAPPTAGGAIAGPGAPIPAIPKPPKAPQAGWVPPRTPWGDPDIHGNFTNKYEQGTPMERPASFEGRRVDDVRGQELVKVLQDRQRLSDERAPFLAGDPTGRIRGNLAFGDRGEIVKGNRAWMIIDPADGKIPPLTAEAQQRAAARAAARPGRTGSSFSNGPFNTVEDFSLYDRCITRGLPGSMLPAIYGDSYQIVQGPGWVGIRYEMIHETRVIPLDRRPHAGRNVRLDMGDARGHWEGNTLVVETTNFRDRTAYRNANSQALKLVERFTRTAPDIVEWTVTVDDPSTWVRPWTFSLPLTMNDAEPVLEYACHEGNYAVSNMLSATRAEEKAAAASAK
jgi:hypothetical protein